MTFGAVILLFPVILALHNLDEYVQHREFAGAYLSRLPERLRTRRVLAWSATLLTIAVTVLCLCAYFYESPALLWVSVVAIFALSWNAIGHCALSAVRRSLIPGTRSACFLVLPYSAAAIVLMHADLGIAFQTLLAYAVLGAIAVPLAAIVFLALGFGLSRLVTASVRQ